MGVGEAKERKAEAEKNEKLAREEKKAEKKKEYLDKAIKAWNEAAEQAKAYSFEVEAGYRQKAAELHRAKGEHDKAAEVERKTAGELEKEAEKAAKNKDPKRAGELMRVAQTKWNRAATDSQNANPKDPKAGIDDRKKADQTGKEAEKYEGQGKP